MIQTKVKHPYLHLHLFSLVNYNKNKCMFNNSTYIKEIFYYFLVPRARIVKPTLSSTSMQKQSYREERGKTIVIR